MATLPFLFAASLNGTLLPNSGKPSPEGCLRRTSGLLNRLRSQKIPVVYVTERVYETASASVAQFGLPAPNYWLCNAGTEIRMADGGCDPIWEQWLGPEFDAEILVALLGGVDGLVILDRHLPGPHRFTLKISGQLSETWLNRAEIALAGYRNGLRITTYFDADLSVTRLEVLPEAAGRLQGLDFLAQRHALPRRRVFYADDGDQYLLTSGVLGVLVGNGSPAIRVQLRQAANESLYLADGFFGDGVLDGLRHHDLWPMCPGDFSEDRGSIHVETLFQI